MRLNKGRRVGSRYSHVCALFEYLGRPSSRQAQILSVGAEKKPLSLYLSKSPLLRTTGERPRASKRARHFDLSKSVNSFLTLSALLSSVVIRAARGAPLLFAHRIIRCLVEWRTFKRLSHFVCVCRAIPPAQACYSRRMHVNAKRLRGEERVRRGQRRVGSGALFVCAQRCDRPDFYGAALFPFDRALCVLRGSGTRYTAAARCASVGLLRRLCCAARC